MSFSCKVEGDGNDFKIKGKFYVPFSKKNSHLQFCISEIIY